MQCLGISVWNDFGHTLDVAPRCLEQPAQVPAGLMADIASPQAKEERKFLAERQESLTQSFQGRWGMAFLLAFTSLSGVALAMVPRSRSIAPYYASQVPRPQEVLESDKVELGWKFIIAWLREVVAWGQAAKAAVYCAQAARSEVASCFRYGAPILCSEEIADKYSISSADRSG